jgi:hypothetical protein
LVAAAAAVLRRRRLHGALAQRASLLGTGRSGPVSKLTPTIAAGATRSGGGGGSARTRPLRAPRGALRRGECGGVRARRGDGPCRRRAVGHGAGGSSPITAGGAAGPGGAGAARRRRRRRRWRGAPGSPSPGQRIAASRGGTWGRAGLGPGQGAPIAAGAAKGGAGRPRRRQRWRLPRRAALLGATNCGWHDTQWRRRLAHPPPPRRAGPTTIVQPLQRRFRSPPPSLNPPSPDESAGGAGPAGPCWGGRGGVSCADMRRGTGSVRRGAYG